jgi:alkanesulfonate monooxygenase SsuD/methylene tetrahydromethanopterin reductase-like flavin-dependent oxidoreductase (luciferase family)
MDIGISLPTMCRGYSRASTLEWARLADQGPFSSISCGERVTFHNPEAWITLAAAAAVTERLRILMNLSVLPAHPPALVAKQVATLDVLSEGRVTLAVGVGGREHDYRSLSAGFDGRHQRLDDHVATLRSLWKGEPLFDGADPVGPPCVQAGGPPVLAGAMGPKALARAATWADGVIGFSVGGVRQEMRAAADAARRAWEEAGREPPRLVSGCFYALGVPEPATTLRDFTSEYLAFAGHDFADRFAATLTAFDAGAVNRALDGAEEAGLDEFVLVPASPDLAVLEATMELVNSR